MPILGGACLFLPSRRRFPRAVRHHESCLQPGSLAFPWFVWNAQSNCSNPRRRGNGISFDSYFNDCSFCRSVYWQARTFLGEVADWIRAMCACSSRRKRVEVSKLVQRVGFEPTNACAIGSWSIRVALLTRLYAFDHAWLPLPWNTIALIKNSSYW